MSMPTPPMPTAAPAARSPLPALPAATRPLPKAPALGWDSFVPRAAPRLPSLADLPHVAHTTSGRAALLAALRQLHLPAGSGVLVPTYHCPTMVAPVLQAGLQPLFFAIGPDGLPLLDAIDAGATSAAPARAMFVAHYFGLPQSLAAVSDWCRARGIVLVEDCAHSYFGQAGERPVGHWGDYATASVSKFFPVAEGGLLASLQHPLAPLRLRPPGARAHVKGALDTIEYASLHGRLAGLRHAAAPLLWLKNRGRAAATGNGADEAQAPAAPADFMASCDMARAEDMPSLASRALHALLPVGGIVRQRRANFADYGRQLAVAPGARPLAPVLPDATAPYVWPLWIDNAERADAIYARMRAARLPVFRWDRLWPGTPTVAHDAGARWSRQVLQMLCHQSLSADDIADVSRTTLHILQAS